MTDSAGNTYTEADVVQGRRQHRAERLERADHRRRRRPSRPSRVKTTASADIGATRARVLGPVDRRGHGGRRPAARPRRGRRPPRARSPRAPPPPSSGGRRAGLGFYADSGFGAHPRRRPRLRSAHQRLAHQRHGAPDPGSRPGRRGSHGQPHDQHGREHRRGWRPPSSSRPPRPAAPSPPSAPGGVTAAPGNGQATVSWTAPSDGGSPITKYTVTPYVGATAQTPTVGHRAPRRPPARRSRASSTARPTPSLSRRRTRSARARRRPRPTPSRRHRRRRASGRR